MLTAACSNVSDGDAPQGLTIHPVGGGLGPGGVGTLVFTVPAGEEVPSNPGTVYPVDAPNQTQTLDFNTPLPLDATPTYCIAWGGMSDCTVKLTNGQTTTYTLGALHVTTNPEMFNTDGSFPTYLIITNDESKETVLEMATSEYLLQVMPGHFTSSFQKIQGYPSDIAPAPSETKTVGQGEVVEWPIMVPEWRFTVHVTIPTERDLPDVSSGTQTYQITGPGGGNSWFTPTSDFDIHLPPASPSTPYSYTFSVFGMPMTIPAGGPGQTFTVTTQRLDVADVDYTNSNGTHTTIQGQWSVTRKGGAPGPATDTLLTFNHDTIFPTNTGIDVIAGTYDGMVTYTQNGPQSYTFNATF